MTLLQTLFGPRATPHADRYGLFTRTAADDLKDLGFGGGTTEDEEDETQDGTERAAEDDESAERTEAQDATDQAEDASTDDEDETDPDYKKRFINSQKQHLEDKREMEQLRGQISSVEQELRRLRTPATTTPTPPTGTRRGLNEEDFYAELSSVSSTDPDAKKKVVSKWVKAIKEEARAAVEEAKVAARQEVQGVETQKKAYDKAKQNGLSALERAGFRKEDLSDAFDDLEREVNHLMATDPAFFQRHSDTEQFAKLSETVKARWDRRNRSAAVEANQKHERKAGGTIGSSRQDTPSRKPSKGGNVSTLSFSEAMAKDRENRKQVRMGLIRRSA